MLLGNPAEPGTEPFHFETEYFREMCEEKWLKSVQDSKSQDYGDAFDPNQFDICLKDRLKTFSGNLNFAKETATDDTIPELMLNLIRPRLLMWRIRKVYLKGSL